jgi:tetratricopeptide (TPR) repeat protein
MVKRFKWFGVIVLALFLLSGLAQGSTLFNRGIVNVGLTDLAKATSCDPEWFDCKHAADRSLSPPAPRQLNQLTRALALLESAERWSPSAITRLHLATVRFLAGDRQSALSLLSQAASYPPGRSPLLSEGRYEYYLTRARAAMQSEKWMGAINDFHKAMVLEPDRILPVDDRDLYIALAAEQTQEAEADASNARAAYLAGKYLIQAGAWSEGLDLLRKTRIEDNSGQLPATELTMAELYSARALRETRDVSAAQAALEKAIRRSPELRLPYIDLLELLRKTGNSTHARDVEQRLATLGPKFRLGQFGSDFSLDQPTVLPNGWRLVGYEVDEQLLEWTTWVDLVLWWEAPAGVQPGDAFLHVDGYWLQRQTVRNLFPNSGFEWGTDDRGIPLGHGREYYAAPKGSLGVETSDRNGEPTQVLWAQNNASVQHVALISEPFVVDASAYYLMAGWLRDEDQLAKLGRLCVEQRFGPDLSYYIESPEGGRPAGDWLHIANLAPAIPGGSPINCETFVSNSNSRGKSSWDNVLFVRLPTP